MYRRHWEHDDDDGAVDASAADGSEGLFVPGGPQARRRRRGRPAPAARPHAAALAGLALPPAAAAAPAGPRAPLAAPGAALGRLRRLLPTGRQRVRPLLP